MKFNFEKLTLRILLSVGSIAEFAKKMNVHEKYALALLDNRKPWELSEIDKACEVLEIPASSIDEYFFTMAS